MFNTSIIENIRLGKGEASVDEVKKAAKLANCMDFIERLPDGFDTVIGENGAELIKVLKIYRNLVQKTKLAEAFNY